MASERDQPTISKVQGPLIVLDAGHGGKDEGAKVRSLQEKKITLLTTLYTKKYLEEMGYRVLLTRSKDTYVPLAKRVLIANKMNCSLFVSVHFNTAPNHLAQGLEVYYTGESSSRGRSSRKLANFLLYYVMDQTGALSRGVKLGNHLYVIRETQMPAVLFEAGFMTNLEEGSKMKDKVYLQKIAKGISQGVDRYLRS
jgi:N-acetylmuramoyl-L-alanine amidase